MNIFKYIVEKEIFQLAGGGTMKAHQNNSKTYHELNYAAQASSITSTINNLERAIKAHKKEAIKLRKKDPTPKFAKRLMKMANGL